MPDPENSLPTTTPTALDWRSSLVDRVANNGNPVLSRQRDVTKILRFSHLTDNYQRLVSKQVSQLEPL